MRRSDEMFPAADHRVHHGSHGLSVLAGVRSDPGLLFGVTACTTGDGTVVSSRATTRRSVIMEEFWRTVRDAIGSTGRTVRLCTILLMLALIFGFTRR